MRRLLWLSLFVIGLSNPGRCDTFEQIAHFGGNCQAVAAQGNIAYFSTGFDLNVFDISNPGNPVGLNRISLPANIQDIKVVGSLVYVADAQAGLLIIDASDPGKLKIVGRYDTPGSAQDVVVNGDLAYIADGNSGLLIVNIKNPATITRIGGIGTFGSTQGVAYANGLIYAADGTGGFHVIDVSDPFMARRRGGYGATYATKITVAGGIAYAVDYGFGLRILDISTPDAIKQLGTYATNSCSNITLWNGKAYLSCRESGMLVLDIMNPGKPSLIGAYDTPTLSLEASITGNMACVADSTSLQLIDIQIPQRPVKRSSCELLTKIADDLAISGKYGDAISYAGGLQFLNLENPIFPRRIGPYVELYHNQYSSIPCKTSINNKNIAVVMQGYSIHLFDFNHPDQPVMKFGLGGLGFIKDFILSDNRLFLAIEKTSCIYDISEPAAPKFLGRNITSTAADSIAVQGNKAFIAQGSLLTLDISDPSAPLKRSFWGNSITGVTADDHFVYAMDTNSYLSILDPKDPTNLILVSQVKTRSNHQKRLKIVDGFLYVYGPSGSSPYNTFDVIDVRNPRSPKDIWVSSVSRIYGLDAAGNRIYATGDYGVYLFQRKRDGLGVSNFSRDYYLYDYLKPGSPLYSDQAGAFTGTLPQWFDDCLYIQTRSVDKDLTRSNLLNFTINQQAVIIVALDERITTPPTWLAGWARLGAKLTTDDPASPRRVLYRKRFDAGTVTLGPNRETGMPAGRSMYSVIVAPPVSAAEGWGQYQ